MTLLIKVLFIFLIIGCTKGVEQKKIIRIISIGLVLDGGSISMTFLDEKNEMVKIYVYCGGLPETPKRLTSLGSVYLNEYPGGAGSIKCNKQQIMKIRNSLKMWCYYNIEQYGFLNAEKYKQAIAINLKKNGNKNLEWNHRSCLAQTFFESIDVYQALYLIDKGLGVVNKPNQYLNQYEDSNN